MPPDPMKARRAKATLVLLAKARPGARIELNHRSPFELLIATILSAQCTDARVNRVTPALFQAFPDPGSMAAAAPQKIEGLIRSTGFFRAKARSILGCCRALVERHGGQVPRTMDELSALPGVGRKTANVVLGGAYGIAEGIVVDTHMARVARRLRWTGSLDPVRIERDLMALFPRSRWVSFSLLGVLHGRYVCVARRPHCFECPIRRHCPSKDLTSQAVHRPRPGHDRG